MVYRAPAKPETVPGNIRHIRFRRNLTAPIRFVGSTGLFGTVIALLAVTVAVLVLWPLARILYVALFLNGHFYGWTDIASAFSAPGIGQVFVNTAILSVSSSALALLVGGMFAWLTQRTDAHLGWVTDTLPLAPLFMPAVAISIGWVFLLTPGVGYLNAAIRNLLDLVGVNVRTGPLNIYSWYGLIFVASMELVPLAYLVIAASLQSLDPTLEEASRMSGAGLVRTICRVTIPAIRTGIGNAMLIVTLFTAPEIIGTPANIRVLSVQIFDLLDVSLPAQYGQAAALGVFMMAVLALVWYLSNAWRRRGGQATIQGEANRYSVVHLGKLRWIAWAFMLCYLLCSAVLPFLALLTVALSPYWAPHVRFSTLSLQHFKEIFAAGSSTVSAMEHSYALAGLVATVGVILVSLMLLFARNASIRVQGALNGVLRLPAGMPQVMIAIGLILAYAGPPFRLGGTLAILAIAYLVLYLPQTTTAVASTSDQVGQDLLDASALSGAGPARTYRKIVFRLTAPGLVAAWGLLFALVVGDLVASVLLAGGNTPVMGAVILQLMDNGTFSQVAALCVIAGMSTGIVVLISRRLLARSFQARR